MVWSVAVQRFPIPSRIIEEISEELDRSMVHGSEFRSLHEAYAVIFEEVDELWEIAKQKRRDRDPAALRVELIQIATMAIKTIRSMESSPHIFTGGTV